MTITISDQAITDAKLNPDELRIEFALLLYSKKVLSWGKARKLAGLDEMSFRKEMTKRDMYMHYDIEDLEKDLKNLDML